MACPRTRAPEQRPIGIPDRRHRAFAIAAVRQRFIPRSCARPRSARARPGARGSKYAHGVTAEVSDPERPRESPAFVRILGAVRFVTGDGETVDLPSPSQRRLLAALALAAGGTLRPDYLSDLLEVSPGALRTAVSRLRARMGEQTIGTDGAGYRVTCAVDATRFTDLLVENPALPDRLAALEEALALWDGEAIDEFRHEPWAEADAARLDELRCVAIEDRAELLSRRGRAGEAVASLEAHVAKHPLRDRARGLLIQALAIDGRQADALRAYQAYRALLAEETGTEPSAPVRAIERRVAAGWSGDESSSTGTLPVGTVSFLLTDIVESTPMWHQDPDAMAEAVVRHYQLLDAAITAHDGVRPQEQGEGDSVVAAFSRASDALAAARDAQIALQRAAWPTPAPIKVRMAVHTGIARLRGETNYVGPTIIRAARLRDVARGGQILISAATRELAGALVDNQMSTRDLGVHHLKGFTDAVRVYQLLHPDLATDFDPLVQSTRTNLPVPLSTFIGRELELAALNELQTGTRLLTITGSGGAGKTSLALKLAWAQLDRFPDGVWWLELAPLPEPAQVATALAGVLEARVDDATPALDAVVRRLARDRALVVLDNCEHLVDASATLAARVLQHCPTVSVLTTSRAVLGVPGEVTWRVPPLSFPPVGSVEALSTSGEFDAVRLFVDRARHVRPNFAVADEILPAIVEICQRLDGIPLAIELAAARTKSMTVGQILDALEHRLQLLTGGSRTSPPRQQTLEASIAWSMDLLDDGDRALVHRLSVFSGSFDLAAVEAVCADDDPAVPHTTIDVVDSLDRLIDHSLVLALDGDRERRFAQLETVRQFGAYHLDGSGTSSEVRKRHATYFGALAERVAPNTETADEIEAVEQLDAEIDNLRSALIWLRDSGDAGAFASMVSDLAPYWSLTGTMAESLSWLTAALDALPDERPAIRARLLAHRGSVRSNMGDYSGSMRDCRTAIAIGEDIGDPWPVGRAYWVLAELAAYVDLDLWRPLSERSIEALTASGDRWALGYARLWQAVPYLMRASQPEGIAALAAAAPAIDDIANPTLNASYKIWEGWAALQAGELRRTDQLATEVMTGPGFRLATQQLFGDLLLAAAARYRGLHHPVLEQFPDRAKSALRHGETLAAVMYQYWESLCLLFDDPAAALDRARECIARHGESYPSAACAVQLVAALAAFAVGEVEASWSHSDAAEALTVPMKWPLNRTRQLLVRSLLLVERGDLAAAEEVARSLVALARKEELNIELVYGLEVHALIAATRDHFADAARLVGVTAPLRAEMELADNFLPLSVPVGRAVDRAREALGVDAFAEQLAAGARLGVSSTLQLGEELFS